MPESARTRCPSKPERIKSDRTICPWILSATWQYGDLRDQTAKRSSNDVNASTDDEIIHLEPIPCWLSGTHAAETPGTAETIQASLNSRDATTSRRERARWDGQAQSDRSCASASHLTLATDTKWFSRPCPAIPVTLIRPPC